MLRVIKILLILTLFFVSSCKEGRTDYHKLTNLEDVLEDPRKYEGQRLHLAGYAHYQEGLSSSLELYIDKEQAKHLDNPNIGIPPSLILLPVDGFEDSLLNCSDRVVSVYGVLFLNPSLGLILHLEKGIKEVKGQEVGDFCYKTIDKIPEETLQELMRFHKTAPKVGR
ncbi:hypothetical protein [Kangiella sp.]|uniref:hypothetical protein n=1 Tax=Kangiella sp. TaxID=1920245 RepID=UPI003A92AA0E